MECFQILKRKRGRPPKVPRDSGTFEIDLPLTLLADPNTQEIHFGYSILQDILKVSKSKHLLDKPDDNLFGLHDYYEIIQKPMWFNKVLTKFSDQEYKDIKEIISDIRQVFENCYRFWGPKHRFSKQAFRLEKLLEKELQAVPEHIRGKCLIEEDGDENKVKSESGTSYFTEDFSSKIMKNLEKKEKEEAEVRKQVDLQFKDELLEWESEVLMMKQYKKQITFIPEVAEIGHFLSLCHDILCLKKITQCEVERMLLMPKESSTLSTIMTALLCPSAMRGNLYFKPVMVYEVWSRYLSKKVDTWYNNFVKIGNKTQMFIRYGIETDFWEAVGEVNPLLNLDFSSITFTKRVWVMKTLCTTLFHSFKKIEEYFNSVEEAGLRGPVVYEDGKFEYISLFLPEIRVYRICRSEMDIDSKGEAIAIIPVKNGFPPDIQFHGQGENSALKSLGKKNKFHLAAYNTETLTSLIKVFSQKKKSLSALRGLVSYCEQSESKTLETLHYMKNQWLKYKERCVDSVNNSIKYWLDKEISPPISPAEPTQFFFKCEPVDPMESLSSSETSTTGKRQLKRKFPLEEWENSSDSSIDFSKLEEDTSDWEEGNIKRKGKRKLHWTRWRESLPGDPFPVRPEMERAPRTPLADPLYTIPMVNPLLQNPGLFPTPSPSPPNHQYQPIYTPTPLPQHPPTPPVPHQLPFPTRPTYRPHGRGRGRGMRMRYYPPVPVKKLVRRPSIVASEITDPAIDQQIRESSGEDVLTISFKPDVKHEPTPHPNPINMDPLKLAGLDDDLLLNDLQAIKIEPPPWLPELD